MRKQRIFLALSFAFTSLAGNCPKEPTPPSPKKACAQMTANDCKSEMGRCELSYRNECVDKGTAVIPQKCLDILNVDRCNGTTAANQRKCEKSTDQTRCQAAGPVALSLTGRPICAITAQNATVCFGNNDYGPVPASLQQPNSTNHIDTSGSFACAVTSTGEVLCWSNASNDVVTQLPNALKQPNSARAVCAGSQHACAITTQGTVECWGNNVKNQTAVPPELKIAGSAQELSCEYETNCALNAQGSVICWGDLTYLAVPAPLKLPNSALSVSIGSSFGCSVTTQKALTCWGVDLDAKPIVVPASLTSSNSMSGVSVGSNGWACVVTVDGKTMCWGEDLPNKETVPLALQAPNSTRQVYAGSYANCAVTTQGGTVCWGGVGFDASKVVPDILAPELP